MKKIRVRIVKAVPMSKAEQERQLAAVKIRGGE